MTNQDLELWHKLQQAELVSGEMPPTQIINNPWYLRVLQGLTGWFAAWFLLGSVFAIFHDFLRQESIALVFGVMFIVGAYFVYRLKDSDFIGQFRNHLIWIGFCFAMAPILMMTIRLTNHGGWDTYLFTSLFGAMFIVYALLSHLAATERFSGFFNSFRFTGTLFSLFAVFFFYKSWTITFILRKSQKIYFRMLQQVE